jgi:hypothetical protein
VDAWVVMFGLLLLAVGGLLVWSSPSVPRSTRLCARRISTQLDERGWSCLVDVSMEDGSVRRLPLRTVHKRPRRSCRVVVLPGPPDHAVLVRSRPYGLLIIPLVFGASLVIGGWRGWITAADLWELLNRGSGG